MSSGGQPFPLSKLAFMYVKKIAQPLANRIAARAKKDERFKEIFCLPPANMYHFYEAKIKFRFMNIGKVRIKKVPKLDEKTAIELGSNLCAEFIIMSIASVIALNEVMKYKERERQKDLASDLELQELNNCVTRLQNIIESQKEDIDRLREIILSYEKK
eukprot:TRINITY_DN5526_c0_g1_i8.p1 TRINITY_DN5526_c0_g1~~TRINITY_DN5526_c0_g1_i8.p1  ORF type:complete len:159 (-),score=14.10 TRINITY_DN5526_c0_g1_i8:392-868(-)